MKYFRFIVIFILPLLILIANIVVCDEIKTEYYPNGNLKYKGEVKDGYYHGKGQMYYKNGSLYYEGEFLKNDKSGKGKLFYESGKLRYEGEFHHDECEGIGKEYYENGNPKYEGKFVDGMFKSGKSYDENGKLIKDDNPENNNLSKSFTQEQIKMLKGSWRLGNAQKKYFIETKSEQKLIDRYTNEWEGLINVTGDQNFKLGSNLRYSHLEGGNYHIRVSGVEKDNKTISKAQLELFYPENYDKARLTITDVKGNDYEYTGNIKFKFDFKSLNISCKLKNKKKIVKLKGQLYPKSILIKPNVKTEIKASHTIGDNSLPLTDINFIDASKCTITCLYDDIMESYDGKWAIENNKLNITLDKNNDIKDMLSYEIIKIDKDSFQLSNESNIKELDYIEREFNLDKNSLKNVVFKEVLNFYPDK